jgi:hypothetical protein
MATRPYGTWPSPLSADLVSRIPGRGFDALSAAGGRVRWAESRPLEGGRVVVELTGSGPADVTPEGFNVRTRVHEYGGGAVWFHGEAVFFSEFSTSRLHRQDGRGAEPRPITPEPPEPNSLRYADGCVTPDGRLVVCVRERHEAGEVWNELVAIPADGSAEPRTIASGHDFYAAPRLDPAGGRLAWVQWDHPRMPWDGTELVVADIAADGALSGERVVAGGAEESVLDPQWSPDGRLHFCSDRDGWWNLHSEDGPLTRLEDGEIGYPSWAFAMTRYAFLEDGRIACVVTRRATSNRRGSTGRPTTRPPSPPAAAGSTSPRPRRRARTRSSRGIPPRAPRRSCAASSISSSTRASSRCRARSSSRSETGRPRTRSTTRPRIPSTKGQKTSARRSG